MLTNADAQLAQLTILLDERRADAARRRLIGSLPTVPRQRFETLRAVLARTAPGPRAVVCCA